MAESLGIEIATMGLEKLISGALKKGHFIIGMESHMETLKQIIPIFEALILDADSSHTTSNARRVTLEQVSHFLDKLRDFSDKRTTRSQIMKKQRFIRKVLFLSSCASFNPIVCAMRDARHLKSLQKEQGRLTNLLNLPFECGNRSQALYQETASLNSKEVIGREEDRDNMIRLLFNSDIDYGTFSVVLIAGIGGMGKTTLAQYVFNDEKVKTHFDVRLWVYVPQVLDAKEVMQRMLSSATDDNTLCNASKMYHFTSLQDSLHRLIFGRRYLLVLDNVWDHENLDLNWQGLIRNILGFGASGSMVLTTTRSEKVAKTMHSAATYMLGDLVEDDSFHLFQRLAFRQGQEPGVEVIGMEIIRMIPRVPLVIDCIGRQLREKSSIDEWEDFRDRLINLSYCEQFPSVMQVLKLSYEELDPRLKLCFAYCSLFPKGYIFQEAELIYAWIALEYLEIKDTSESLVDVAKDYILGLKEKGLLVVKQDQICMHDVIHDLALSVAEHKYKMVDSTTFEYRETTHQHVSFSEKVELSQSFPCLSSVKMTKHLKSLLLFRNYDNWHNLKLEGLSKFECLRVLRLQNAGIEKVPRKIGKLIHLRYLDLSCNNFMKKLPNSITQLVNLVYLNLSCCYRLEELPRDMNELQKLICLDLSHCTNMRKLPRKIIRLVKLRELWLKGCQKLRHMPPRLEVMSNLRRLDYFVVQGKSSSSTDPNDEEEVGKLADLKNLDNLEGFLLIAVNGSGFSESEARQANLQGKKLTMLTIIFKEGLERENEKMLEGFQPHSNLRSLSISGYVGMRLPSWIDVKGYNLKYLQRIYLDDWKTSILYVGSFGKLPHLKFLGIYDGENLEYIESNCENITNSSHHPIAPHTPFFPKLEDLRLWNLPKLKGWGRNNRCVSGSNNQNLMLGNVANAFPCLKRLSLYEVGFEVLPQEFQGLSSLKDLEIRECEDLKELPKWIDNLTFLKELSVEDCPKLISLPNQIARLTNLKSLSIKTKCQQFKETYKRPTGASYHLIQHIPFVDFDN